MHNAELNVDIGVAGSGAWKERRDDMKHTKTAVICTIILFVILLIMLYLQKDRDVRSMDRQDPKSTGYEIYYTDCSDDAEHITYVNMSTQEPPMKPEELSVVTEIEEDTDPEQAADKKADKAAAEKSFSPVPDCGWSKKVQKKVWKICKGYGIDFYLVMAMAEHESDFRAWITGDHEKASGAWQIHYYEWKDLMDKLGYGPDDMYDPVKQADAACAILEGHYKELNRTTYALMAYNGGSAYAKKMTKAGKISRYAEEIIDRAKKWEKEQ